MKNSKGVKDDTTQSQPAANVGANVGHLSAATGSRAASAPEQTAPSAASAVRAPVTVPVTVPVAPVPKARMAPVHKARMQGRRKRRRSAPSSRLATSTDEESVVNSMEMLGFQTRRPRLRPRLTPSRMMIEDGSVSEEPDPPAPAMPGPPAPGTPGLPAPATPAVAHGPRASATPGQPPAADTPAPGTPPPVCQFCLEQLQDCSLVESLRCGHTFHQQCIEKCMRVTGRDKAVACAMGPNCTISDHQDKVFVRASLEAATERQDSQEPPAASHDPASHDAPQPAGDTGRQRLAILPMQDLLSLDSKHRMNTPGTTVNNWRWRFDWSQVWPGLAPDLAKLIKLYGRHPD